MKERTYSVCEILGGQVSHYIATGMSFDMALAFVRGYRETFYNERISLAICEVTDTDIIE